MNLDMNAFFSVPLHETSDDTLAESDIMLASSVGDDLSTEFLLPVHDSNFFDADIIN